MARPLFTGERQPGWTDFNDLAVAEGLDAVRRCIEAAALPRRRAAHLRVLDGGKVNGAGAGGANGAQERAGASRANGADGGGDEERGAAGAEAKPNGHAKDREADDVPAFSDEALALRFARERAHDLRYVAAWNKWLRYDRSRWRKDDTLLAFNLVRALCRKVASGCNDKKKAEALVGSKTVGAVTSLARSDRRIAAAVGQWDADPWLLNTPAGTVDLHTGTLRPHKPEDFITKVAAVAPDPCCPTPLWLTFLDRIMNGDTGLIDYLQRVAGYALTGDISEEAIFFGYGTGANGKGVFTGAISGCLGEYHTAAPVETFTEAHGERHPTELAGLHGARFVTATETQQGKRWDEAKIKALTGGDPISARLMRQDFFEFIPQLKLFISGNHKPSLRNVDEAMRRRFHLIPFAVTIPKAERDKELKAKLKAEWPGILAWAVRGCLDWQEHGLNPPKAVLAATEAYLDAQDSFGAWVEECCELGTKLCELRSQLWASWRGWAERSNEYAGKKSEFWEKLEANGMTLKQEKYGYVYCGLKSK